ncbi:MAG: KpsF/GutQ family sugar-phosphate isomerase [Cardiobacteriaceae bacterium]|nr:KpsF/GutQ family sugar-phosphate isomerase [Cardiobacteriaceae bacterium]
MTLSPRLTLARKTLEAEAEAILLQQSALNEDFLTVVDLLKSLTGKVITTGMGKSGHIAQKVAATLASTGTPAFFMHPADAGHGDLGMAHEGDAVLAFSNSGVSQELMIIANSLKNSRVPLIALTANPKSPLAQIANHVIHLHPVEEACPYNLAPTSSTSAALAIGDALALTLMQERGFSREDFARSHPHGRLGKRLTTYVNHIMRTGDAIPKNSPEDLVESALYNISAKSIGATLIAEHHKLLGIFTDGDLRRALASTPNLLYKPLYQFMSVQPLSIQADRLAYEAVIMMESRKVSVLPVLEGEKLVGVLHIHDLIQAGLA